jgi:uncharacterized membrane protein YeaQ/YmgE (transglycosylase-associated protein family)
MEWIWLILSLVIWGVIFGALGRLAVPGPNPMGIGTTILAGIGGAVLGTLVGLLLQLNPTTNRLIYFVLQVLGAALIVYALSRKGGVRRTTYVDDGYERGPVVDRGPVVERRGFLGRGFGRRY